MFTHPALLLLLPLALVPILLHLLMRLRVRTVELSTFRFLMDSYVKQRRRMRWLEWLLMALRAGFVALIVLLIARPVVDEYGALFGGGEGRDVAIVIDAGASMNLQHAGRTLLAQAKDTARTVVSMLGENDRVTVIAAGGRPTVAAGGFATNADVYLQAIDAIEAEPSAADIAGALRLAAGEGSAAGGRVVYVITNGQRRGWATLRDAGAGSGGDPGHRNAPAWGEAIGQLVVMQVGPAERVANVSVTGQPPRDVRPIVGLPLQLVATVVNGSPDTPASTTLSVMLDDEAVEQTRLTLQPGQTQHLPFTITPTRAGLIEGRFEVTADAFTDDDAYLFSLNVKPKLSVLVVTPEHAGTLVQRPGLYVETALRTPMKARGAASAQSQRIAEALQIETVREDQLNEAQLGQADVVIAADVTVDGQRGSMLRRYVESGGGLILFPGPHANPLGYEDFLFDALPGALPGAGMSADVEGRSLPRYREAIGDPTSEATFQSITGVDTHHPIFAAFDEPELKPFAKVHLYRWRPIELPGSRDASAGEQSVDAAVDSSRSRVLLRLRDGSPAMVEARVGEGRMLIAGFAATPDWSSLPGSWEFVPMLLRSVAHVRRASSAEASAAIQPHEPAAVRLAGQWHQATVGALDPAGKPYTIDLYRAGARLEGALTSTGRRGYYTFIVQPHSPDAPDRIELGFAVNMDPAAADLTMLDESGLRAAVAPLDPVVLRGSPDDPTLRAQLTSRQELWRWLIWAAFAVIAAEFLLATWRVRDGGGEAKARGRLRGAMEAVGWRGLESPARTRG